MRFIVYNPYMKYLKKIEKALDKKPATWEKYAHKENGKDEILSMEIREYKELGENASVKEKCKALKHIAVASILLMESLGDKDDE